MVGRLSHWVTIIDERWALISSETFTNLSTTITGTTSGLVRWYTTERRHHVLQNLSAFTGTYSLNGRTRIKSIWRKREGETGTQDWPHLNLWSYRVRTPRHGKSLVFEGHCYAWQYEFSGFGSTMIQKCRYYHFPFSAWSSNRWFTPRKSWNKWRKIVPPIICIHSSIRYYHSVPL